MADFKPKLIATLSVGRIDELSCQPECRDSAWAVLHRT